MEKVLDKILLSDNAKSLFYVYYNKKDFEDWILKLLPEVEDCKNQKQDNPWHIFGCLDHILTSVECMNKQTQSLDYEERRMLAYIMFLHDIGKPKCYIRRYSNLYKRKVDSFFEHNKASAETAKRVLGDLGFNSDEIEKMLLLIEEHDVFISLRLKDDGNPHHRVLTSEFVDEIIDKLSQVGDGIKLFKQLIMIGRSDNLAQNPSMTEEALQLLDKVSEILAEKSASPIKID